MSTLKWRRSIVVSLLLASGWVLWRAAQDDAAQPSAGGAWQVISAEALPVRTSADDHATPREPARFAWGPSPFAPGPPRNEPGPVDTAQTSALAPAHSELASQIHLFQLLRARAERDAALVRVAGEILQGIEPALQAARSAPPRRCC